MPRAHAIGLFLFGTFGIDEGGSARVHRWWPGGIDVEIDGHRASSRVTRDGDSLHVQHARGTVELHVVPRFTVPGNDVVAEVHVARGEQVETGAVLMVIDDGTCADASGAGGSP